MALNGTGLNRNLPGKVNILRDSKVPVEYVVISSDEESESAANCPLNNAALKNITPTKAKESESSTNPKLLLCDVNKSERPKYSGLTPEQSWKSLQNSIPFVNDCDKKDLDSETLPIRIVEAHSLSPNLWANSENLMDVPSTSSMSPTSKEDSPTYHLDIFIRELRRLGDPKDKQLEDILNKMRKKGLHCGEGYLKSYDFIKKIEDIVLKIKKDRRNFYVYLKEMSDQFKHIIPKKKKTTLNVEENGNQENDSKLQERIDKLYSVLAKLDKSIQKLEKKELSMDDMDEDDSHFILEQKLKKKFNDAYLLICKLEKRDTKTGRPVQTKFAYEGSRFPEINKAIRRLVNTKNGLYFPDFSDINELVEKSNEESRLGLSDNQLFVLAQDIFEDVGKEIKSRRLDDFQSSLIEFLPNDADSSQDPSKKDPELKKQLEKNSEKSIINMNKLIEEFSEKQSALKLEPTEVGDEEADKSPVEDDSEVESEDDNETVGSQDIMLDINEDSKESAGSETSEFRRRKCSEDLDKDLTDNGNELKKCKYSNGVENYGVENDVIVLD